MVYKKTGSAGDYLYELTELGIERARRYWDHCTYFGSVPVSLKDYVASIEAQSVRKQNPKSRDIQQVFSDLSVQPEMILRLAQAVNSGLGLFLFGAPGNGKTLMASRLARAFGETVWIPRALNVGGCIMRLYDPSNHVPAPLTPEGQRDVSGVDERWIRICRPTMVVGGELTLDSFEVRTDSTTGVSEAPIQLKSNCGVLVIDDFGRQRVTPTDILNRWIVPLAQRFDILHLRNGRKFEFPIDQLVVFSTNLEPKALVDEAFLRRIPYKIDVQNPSEDEFRAAEKDRQRMGNQIPGRPGRLPDRKVLQELPTRNAVLPSWRHPAPGMYVLQCPRVAAGNQQSGHRRRREKLFYAALVLHR